MSHNADKPLDLKWCSYSKTVRAMPSNYLAADLSRIDACLWGREDEFGNMFAAAPDFLKHAVEAIAAWDMEIDTPEHNHEDRLEAAIDGLRAAIAKAKGGAA
jgi:hypothetical protein